MLTFNWIDTVTNGQWATIIPSPAVVPCRVGKILYAIVGSRTTAADQTTKLYKSTDSGVTWTMINNACPISGLGNSGLGDIQSLLSNPANPDELHFFAVRVPIIRSIYTISTDTWTAIETTPYANQGPNSSLRPYTYITFRPDGSIILITGNNPNNITIDVAKWKSGAGWTTLVNLASPIMNNQYVVCSGVSDSAGNVRAWIGHTDENTTFDVDLATFSVSYPGDVVSAVATIDTSIESATGFFASNGCVADISSDNEIAFGYGAHINDAPNPPFTGQVKVARGAGGVLSPTWTIELVDNTHTPNLRFGELCEIAVSYGGGAASNLTVLWVSPLDTTTGSQSNDYPFIYQATKSGTWSASVVFDAHTYKGNTTAFVFEFNLVNAFTNGFGAQIQLGDTATGIPPPSPTVGYTGPKIGGGGYVSSGGTLANPGGFASVG